jgi:hypothetical protein
MEDNSTLKTHFKMHQDMLEEFTEELSGMTEQPLAKLLQPKMREAIINHTRVIAKFRQNISESRRRCFPRSRSRGSLNRPRCLLCLQLISPSRTTQWRSRRPRSHERCLLCRAVNLDVEQCNDV